MHKAKTDRIRGRNKTNPTIIVRYFNATFSANNIKLWGKKIKKNIENLNNSTNHHDLLITIEYYT